MTNPPRDHQQRIAAVFGLIAPNYDAAALRFFPACGARLVALAGLKPGGRVLDIGVGTGAVSIPAGRAVGASGSVVGIDIAPEMLSMARQKIDAAGVGNVELFEMNADSLDFPPASFDAALTGFSIFFMPDEIKALSHWRGLLIPGGVMGFSVFGADAFQPMSDLFVERIRAFGVTFPEGRPPFATQKITTSEQCRDLLTAAGYGSIEIHEEQHGYFLKSIDEWWQLVWGSGFRSTFGRVDPDHADAFREAHLADVAKTFTDDGLWINVPVIFAFGKT